jgi:hypothetical protein
MQWCLITEASFYELSRGDGWLKKRRRAGALQGSYIESEALRADEALKAQPGRRTPR